MRYILATVTALDGLVSAIGRIGRWAIIPLVAVTIFDVITRKITPLRELISGTLAHNYLSSGILQEWEWHFHTVLFLSVLGYTYVHDAHVRVDIFHTKLPIKIKAYIEVLGCVLFLVPYSLLLLYFSWFFVQAAFETGQQSSSMAGLGHRWLIKSFLLLGFSLVLLAGISRALRSVLTILDPPHKASPGRYKSYPRKMARQSGGAADE